MAHAYRPHLAASLAAGAALLALACPAGAAISPTDPASASASADTDEEPAQSPAHAVDWLVPADTQSLQRGISRDDDALPPSFLRTMAVADLSQHLLPGVGHRDDLDLNANASAMVRYGLTDQEPLLSEYWWQAIPGVMTTLVAGLILYMRHPVQRKRKYRSTPHEPTGPYKRSKGSTSL